MKKFPAIFFLLLFFVFPSKIFAQVVINEFSSATSNDDWVELYNTSDNSIDLTTYSLVDVADNSKTFSCILAPRGFVVADWSNRLNVDGDTIMLKNGGNVTDCVAYGNGAGQKCDGKELVDLGAISSGEFGARLVDGVGVWNKVIVNTKDAPNDGSIKDPSAVCSAPTPTPIPTPTSTPTPTALPTNTPTSTPTKTPTSSPTKSPTPKATSTPLQTTSGQATSEETAAPQSFVLGLEDITAGNETSELAKGGKNFSFLPFLFTAAGLVCIGVALFLVLKKGKGYNEKSEEKS